MRVLVHSIIEVLLQNLKKNCLKDFINKEYEHYEAGAVYINEKSALWSTNLYEYFDAIIYVDKTKPADNFNLGKIAK